MENFNINDMKNLFGQTPINQLPGVQGYANHKLNWKLLIAGIAVGSVVTLIIVAAVNKKRKKITYVSNGTASKIKSLPKTKDSKSDQFSDYSSEIEEWDEIQDRFDRFDSEIEEPDELDSTE
jgi:hypothetical protein